MRAIVVNCSSTPTHICYNLGARKLADWLKEQGYEVAYYDGDFGMWEPDADIVALSLIFSWHAPLAREIALRMKDRAEVWCGGPGMFALANWWRRETGCTQLSRASCSLLPAKPCITVPTYSFYCHLYCCILSHFVLYYMED